MDANVTDLCNKTFDVTPCRLFNIILCGIIGLAICLIGLCGNCISLLILQKLGKQSVSMFLLKSLSVVDSGYLLGYTFHYTLVSLLDFHGDPRLTFSGYNYFWLRVGSRGTARSVRYPRGWRVFLPSTGRYIYLSNFIKLTHWEYTLLRAKVNSRTLLYLVEYLKIIIAEKTPLGTNDWKAV